jgi:spore germination protein GerM
MTHRLTTTALAVALLATTVACGAVGDSVDAGSTPTRPPTTTGGGAATTAPDGTSATTNVVLYFTRGEKIVMVTRAVPKVTRIGAEAVKALVGGPTAAESADGLGTAIPEPTRFRDLTIADGVAKVDLSRDFESGGGSLSLSLRLAQVTCTLDQFDSVSGVRFLLDGDLVDVFSGNGIVLDKPVSCADYADFVDGTPPAATTFPGIWPFTSQAEMDAYLSGTDRTFTVPVDTAKAFGVRYLGMVNPAPFGPPTPVAGGLVEVKLGFTTGEGGLPTVDPQPSMSVFLLSGHADGDQGPWTVVRATSPQIVVTEPIALDRISSPVAVRGQAATFEGNVVVEVREDGMLDGANLGRGFVTGRGDGVLGDFAGDIAFTAPSEPAGAVIFSERSMADPGGVVRATVVKVTY